MSNIFFITNHLISLLEGKMPQTPLVDKMFNMQVDSAKKMKSSKLLFGEQDAMNQAIQNSLQNKKNEYSIENLQPSLPYKDP